MVRRPTLAASALLLASSLAWGQYKVVSPDGRVTYTDRPPAGGSDRVAPLFRPGTTVTPPRTGAPATPLVDPALASALAALPFELRQVATRFPVVLYTAADCNVCDLGRQSLQQRGIPFTERRVLTEDDAVALQRIVGWRTVPTLAIGAQLLRGYSANEWSGYLDAAGYPRESRLPRGWAAPSPAPLVPATTEPPAFVEPRVVTSPPPRPAEGAANAAPAAPSIRF